ncbi:MAG TPA: protein translocase subunit SecF [Acidobacteriaceae bacterium]|nr:protein translocase subunit SecF [Acidobacteriaceae bacterium]
MEFFKQVDIDWLGKKWYFLAFSLVFSVSGLLSILFWHHIPLGVDFKGGTLITVKFADTPQVQRIRHAVDHAGLHDVSIQNYKGYSRGDNNEVIVSLPQRDTSEAALDSGRNAIVQTLEANYSPTGAANAGKLDIDNATRESLAAFLKSADPLHINATSNSDPQYAAIANTILNYRDQEKGGLIDNLSELNGRAAPAVVSALQAGAYSSGFTIRDVQIVGPQVGAQLRKQAIQATLYSLAGMLVYLWFRFELIYGVAAVVAVFHDTLITIGIFSLTNREMTLTVIAAILTLIGYSMNDTIVVFDRIRENLHIMRRDSLSDIVNRSINQTLSRTVLTSGLTFLTVLSLFIFGGEVLNGFSFALVIGILVGTYSSIAVAAPMLVAYQDWRTRRGKAAALPAGKRARAS